jgi:hypothetical protein
MSTNNKLRVWFVVSSFYSAAGSEIRRYFYVGLSFSPGKTDLRLSAAATTRTRGETCSGHRKVGERQQNMPIGVLIFCLGVSHCVTM